MSQRVSDPSRALPLVWRAVNHFHTPARIFEFLHIFLNQFSPFHLSSFIFNYTYSFSTISIIFNHSQLFFITFDHIYSKSTILNLFTHYSIIQIQLEPFSIAFSYITFTHKHSHFYLLPTRVFELHCAVFSKGSHFRLFTPLRTLFTHFQLTLLFFDRSNPLSTANTRPQPSTSDFRR